MYISIDEHAFQYIIYEYQDTVSGISYTISENLSKISMISQSKTSDLDLQRQQSL